MNLKMKVALGVVVLIAGVCFFPVITPVSDHTKIVLRQADGAPLAGVTVHQTWGVYGWGGSGGQASLTTDAEGVATFPPRSNTAFLGPRLSRWVTAALTQHVYSTERWGPLVEFDVDLPAGRWLPANWPVAVAPRDDLANPNFPDGPRRSIALKNSDPLHPHATISGDAHGFEGDVEVIVRLRVATGEEERFIRESEIRHATTAPGAAASGGQKHG